ncbi:MAG TPA: ABC transporter ATP-binding protein [Bacteroides graminisolvens]|nr:ABC transporter ATP-binding protein [Bacteroides graminisolvens]
MQIEITNISKSFDENTVLNIPQLSINDNELVGIIGNNGAGKTTLFRLCLDLLRADKGNIFIEKEDVSKSESWKTITSSFIDERFLIDFLTPKEYFHFIGNLYNIKRIEIDDRINHFSHLMGNEIMQKKNKYIGQFSKGNKQKIGIIGAMITYPKLLILDEPFNYLDPSSQIIMKELLQNYNHIHGTTILLSSHNLQYVMDICSRVIVLDSGHVIYDEVDLTKANKGKIEQYFLKY